MYKSSIWENQIKLCLLFKKQIVMKYKLQEHEILFYHLSIVWYIIVLKKKKNSSLITNHCYLKHINLGEFEKYEDKKVNFKRKLENGPYFQ